jgi:hypothetical protein
MAERLRPRWIESCSVPSPVRDLAAAAAAEREGHRHLRGGDVVEAAHGLPIAGALFDLEAAVLLAPVGFGEAKLRAPFDRLEQHGAIGAADLQASAVRLDANDDVTERGLDGSGGARRCEQSGGAQAAERA